VWIYAGRLGPSTLVALALLIAAACSGSSSAPQPTSESTEQSGSPATMSPPESAGPSAPAAVEPGGEIPPARFLATTLWDPDHHNVLLYAGYDRTVRSELFRYDPATDRFDLIDAADGPSGRFAHTAVWDSDHHQMIVHGGANDTSHGGLSDTWAFAPDTNTWRRLATGGPSRIYSAAVWDLASHRMLLFGGFPTGYQQNDNQLWSFEPESGRWEQLSSAGAPPPRYGHSATWDPVRARMLIFGGWTGFPGAPNYSDLWAYDPAGGTWATLAKGSLIEPLGRLRHAAVWDGANNTLVIVAGLGGGKLDDVWRYEPSADSWSRESAGGLPRRDRHAAVWDPDSGVVLAFGGNNQVCFFLSDVWAYSASTHQWLRSSGAAGAGSRSYSHLAWIDDTSGELFTHGACDGDVGLPHTAVLNLDSGEWRTLPGDLYARPSADSASAWDASGRRLFVYGGRDLNYGLREFDPATGMWTDLGRTGGPPAAWGSAGVWDAGLHRFLVYGGRASEYYGDVWAYDPARPGWERLAAAADIGPGRRAQSAAVWIDERAEMLLFGGRLENLAGDLGIAEYNDLWAFNSSTRTWRRLPAGGAVPPRLSNATLIHAPGSDEVLLFGGFNNVEFYVSGELWAYSLSAGRWRRIEVESEAPSARFLHAAAWDRTSGRMVVYGGYSPQGGVVGDVWAFSPASAAWTKLGPGPHETYVASTIRVSHEPAGSTPAISSGAPRSTPTSPASPEPAAGPLSGSILSSAGVPGSGVEVVACSATTPNPCPRTISDGGGLFTLEIGPGTYSVSFIPPGASGPVTTVTMRTGVPARVTLP
jgi:N-acetylneuraminic acid mutarotase